MQKLGSRHCTGETVSQEGRAGRHWTKESHLPLSGDQKQLAAVGRRQEQPVTVAERAASVLHTQHTTPRMASTKTFQYFFFCSKCISMLMGSRPIEGYHNLFHNTEILKPEIYFQKKKDGFPNFLFNCSHIFGFYHKQTPHPVIQI